MESKALKQKFIDHAVRLNIELWEPIKEYPNYEVSTFGNVRNVSTGKILKPRIERHGYSAVILYRNRKGKNHRIHRLVANAFIPNLSNKSDVDHIDNNKLNNNITNLRFASRSENNQNTTLRNDNTSGYKGVTWNKCNKTWIAQIVMNGKRKYLGSFDNIEDAVEARQVASLKYFGEYRHKSEQ